MQKTWVQSLGRDDPLEKEMASQFSILSWEILWTEESGRLQSMGSQRIGLDLATEQQLLPKASVQLLHQNLNLTDHPSSPNPLGSATHPPTRKGVHCAGFPLSLPLSSSESTQIHLIRGKEVTCPCPNCKGRGRGMSILHSNFVELRKGKFS